MTENTNNFNFKLSVGGADFGERFWDNPNWRRKILAFIIETDARLEESRAQNDYARDTLARISHMILGVDPKDLCAPSDGPPSPIDAMKKGRCN